VVEGDKTPLKEAALHHNFKERKVACSQMTFCFSMAKGAKGKTNQSSSMRRELPAFFICPARPWEGIPFVSQHLEYV